MRSRIAVALLGGALTLAVLPAAQAAPQVAAGVAAGEAGVWASCSFAPGGHVRLQVNVAGNWRTLARGRVTAQAPQCLQAGFPYGAVMRYTAPSAPGVYPVRVRVVRAGQTQTSAGPALVVTAPLAPSKPAADQAGRMALPRDAGAPRIPSPLSRAYSFGTMYSNGTAAHWDRCQPIRWTLDPTNMDALGRSAQHHRVLWKRALRDISAVTGYRFRYVEPPAGVGRPDGAGRFDVGPGSGHPGIDLVLSYGSAHGDPSGYNYPPLAGSAAGVGATASRMDPASGQPFIESASVIVDAADMSAFSMKQQSEVMYHELGHAMGLGHSVPGQNMHAVGNGSHPVYEDGDLSGLVALSRMPCRS